jgi:hypothetical protein
MWLGYPIYNRVTTFFWAITSWTEPTDLYTSTTSLTELCHTPDWAIPHLWLSYHISDWAIPHLWKSYPTSDWAVPHLWLSYTTSLKKLPHLWLSYATSLTELLILPQSYHIILSYHFCTELPPLQQSSHISEWATLTELPHLYWVSTSVTEVSLRQQNYHIFQRYQIFNTLLLIYHLSDWATTSLPWQPHLHQGYHIS